MHISLIASGIGAIVAAIGGGVLLARCFRQPRSDLIAFSIALLGLLISLGSQALGYLDGFDAAMFRAMELGGQVIAPLALILGLSEIAARSGAVRFCARLYIPALGLVAVVVLAMDQLALTTFSKTWPDPAVFYQTPPNYVLEFAIGPVTALVAVLAMGVVAYRAGQPGWNAVLPAQLMGGLAALLLAYPALAALAAYQAKIHLPVASVFAPLEAAAAALTWLAGMRAGRVPLASRSARDDAWSYDDDQAADYGRVDQTGDFTRFEPATDGGVYRGGGLYRPDPPGQATARRYEHDEDPDLDWRDNRSGSPFDEGWGDASRSGSQDWRGESGGDEWRADQQRSGYETPDFATGDFATGDYATGDFAHGDQRYQDDLGGRAAAGAADYLGRPGNPDILGGASHPGEDPARAQLFGQIAIFTLLEDRVEEFDQLTGRVVDQVRSREPDTLVFIVHAVPSAPMQRILYEVYRDRTAYEWHNQQPHVRQFEADKRPYVLATNVIELGLQQAKVSPFPSVTELFSEPGYDTAGFERPDYLRDYGRTSAQPGGGSREYR
jgi:quinol monooxygenase YgiN